MTLEDIQPNSNKDEYRHMKAQSDTPAPLSADSLRELDKILGRHTVHFNYSKAETRVKLLELIAAALQAERQRIADSLPEKKTLKTDIDDSGWEAEGQKFCVECGQYEFEGVLDCCCVGFNEAIDSVRAILTKEQA